MTDAVLKINYPEAELFYKSPHALTDYSSVQSFTLIRSSIELFAYYNALDFSADDIKEFFSRMQINKNGKVFIPSVKKITGILECCMSGSENKLSENGGIYHIESWNTDGYRYEIIRLKSLG